MIFTFGIALAVFGAAWAVAADPPWRTVAGGRYLVFPPAHPAGEKWPLLFALHGMGGEAQSYGRLWRDALGGGYLVVAPQAPLRERNGAMVASWGNNRETQTFLLGVWDEVHQQHQIDPAHTVVAGYSAGGYALWTLVNARVEQVAGVIFQAAVPRPNAGSLKGKHVFLIAGEGDGSFDRTKADQAFEELTRQGAAVQMYVAPGASHASVYDKIRPAAAWILADFSAPRAP